MDVASNDVLTTDVRRVTFDIQRRLDKRHLDKYFLSNFFHRKLLILKGEVTQSVHTVTMAHC